MTPAVHNPMKTSVTFAFAALWAGTWPAFAQFKDQIGFTQLQGEYPLLPAGQNLTVLQAEGAADWTNYAWAVSADGEQAGRSVTYLPVGVVPTVFSPHANGVAADLVGSATSIIPQTPRLISCQNVYYIDNSLNVGQVAAPMAATWDLENHSWAWSDTVWSVELDRRIDWRVDQQGVTIAACLANGDTTPVPYVLSSAYNVIAVGRTDGGHSRGGTLIDGVGRCKPDLVAPEPWTSNATPVVASCAGLLIDQAKSDSRFALARDPRVIKALLLAGATKEQFPGWSHSATQPLDVVFGAGQVNIGNSYRMLVAGRQPAGNTWASGMGWDKGTSGSGAYFLEVPAGKAAALSAVLTWNRTITPSTDWTTLAPSLADLNLRLSNATTGFGVGTLIAESRSSIDNVEHIYLPDLPAGRYVLEVTGPASVVYGFAWRSVMVDLAAPAIALPPVSQTVAVGGTATFTASVTGYPAPTYQWSRDGIALTDGSGFSGTATATLTLANVQFTDAGFYSVVATNSLGRAESAAATLTVFLPDYGFLQQLYLAVLGRDIDPGALAAYGAALAGGRSRAAVLADLLGSAEYTSRQIEPAIRLYYAALARMPDFTGLKNWSGALNTGFLTLAGAGDQFVSSPEFIQRYGNLDNTGFVQQLYRNVLGREADAAGLVDWVARLDAGASRGTVLVGFSESDEFKRDLADHVEIPRLYFLLLQRMPTPAELQKQLEFLRGDGQTDALLAQGQPGGLSDTDFVQRVFQGFLRRDADAEALSTFAGALTAGAVTHGVVVETVMNSPEFGSFVAPVSRLYLAALLRVPDAPGLDNWVAFVRAGNSLQAAADAFAATPEFINRYGAMDDAAYVTALYENILGREPDSAGLADWVSQLGTGAATRAQILIGFAQSPEAIQRFAPTLRTFLHYWTFLNAAPTQKELDDWGRYFATLADQLGAELLAEAEPTGGP